MEDGKPSTEYQEELYVLGKYLDLAAELGRKDALLGDAIELLREFHQTEPVWADGSWQIFQCIYCEEEHLKHKPDCPWIRAKLLLDKLF